MDIAERVQCPIDYVAVAAVVAVAGVVGRKVGIRPKRHDNWLVVPNLWGSVIGRPGVLKTPAITEPLKPLQRLEVAAKRKFDKQIKDRLAAEMVAKVKQRKTDAEIREALDGDNADEKKAMEIARDALDNADSPPVRKRYLVNDTTVEKLGEILNENTAGVTLFRDELIGFLKGLEKDGQEPARAFYLEAWNGTGRHSFDRIGRGTIDIESACVSIIGGIQPGPLCQYLRAAARGGFGDDGFIQRFQLTVWPDVIKEWANVDRWPDSEARDKAFAIFEWLDQLDPVLSLGADHDKLEPDGIPFLHFTDEAQRLFDEWREVLEVRVRSGDEHPAVESHLAKYRSLIPSLALLFHLAEGGRGQVGIEPLRKAIGWGVYLESHAQRVYSQAIHADLVAARTIAKKILSGDLEDGFALRDVYRKGWAGLSNPDDTKEAIDLLIELHWIMELKQPTAGRISTTYRINPRLAGSEAARNLQPAPKATDKGDRRGGGDPSGGSVGTAPKREPGSDVLESGEAP